MAANRFHGVVEVAGVGDASAAREALTLDVELPPVRTVQRIHDEPTVRWGMAFPGNGHSWIMTSCPGCHGANSVCARQFVAILGLVMEGGQP